MKKKVLSVLMVFMMCLGLAGCGGGSNSASDDISGKVSLNGSTSMEKFVNALSEGIKEKYPNLQLEAQFTGSGAGLEAVASKTTDIGDSSRALTDEEKAKSQALDLDDMGACLPAKVVIRSGSYEDLDDADILVNAIGRSRKEGETRLDMFGDSMERLKDIIPKIQDTKFRGILISITNPADVVGECLRKALGIERFRCFSTGTSLDSLRIKRILEEKTGYHRNSIEAFCMGEHGILRLFHYPVCLSEGNHLQNFKRSILIR